MEREKTGESKSIRELVEVGTLIDVTDAAKKEYIRYPAFISTTLWNGTLKRSDAALNKILFLSSCFYECTIGYDHYGPNDFGTFTGLIEHDEVLGKVVVYVELKAEEELRLKRITGDRMVYLT